MLTYACYFFNLSTAMTGTYHRNSGTQGNKQLYLTTSKNNKQMKHTCRDFRHQKYQMLFLANTFVFKEIFKNLANR